MTIRHASMEDVDAIREVARASWETDYPEILSRETAEEGVDEWYSPEQLRRTLTEPWTVIVVAETEGAVDGFAHAMVDGDDGVVMRLYVHPDRRREGLGRRLFAETREALLDEGVDRIEAMVLAENDPGNEFYADLGFERADQGQTRIGGQSFPENRYVMTVE